MTMRNETVLNIFRERQVKSYSNGSKC